MAKEDDKSKGAFLSEERKAPRLSKNLKSNSPDAMKGGQPFIFNPQGWLCRPEERLISRFLADFLSVCRRPYKKIRTTCKTVASVLHVTGCQKYFFDTLRAFLSEERKAPLALS